MADASTVPKALVRTQLETVVDVFEDAAALVDHEGRIVGTNRAWREMGFSDAVFADGDPLPVAAAASGELVERVGIGRRGGREGWRWYRSRVRAVSDLPGVAAVLTHRDITDERTLQLHAARLPIAHLELGPDGSLQGVNERWQELRGRPADAERGHRWLRDTPEPQRAALSSDLRAGQPFAFELSTAGPDDRRLVLRMEFEPVHDGDTLIGWNALASDRTDIRALEHAAENALVDTVTGLASRAVFETTLARELAGRGTHELAVLFIDLDGFKAVNDRFGHVAGDTVLRTVANRLEGVLRPDDLIARYGGDEFAVLLDHVDESAAVEVGQRLADTGRTPIAIDPGELDVGVSVGVALSRPGDDIESIVGRADQAMYRAKHSGGGTVHTDAP